MCAEQEAIDLGRRFLAEYAANEKVDRLIDAALKLADCHEETVDGEWGPLCQPLEEVEAVRAAIADIRPERAARVEYAIERGDRVTFTGSSKTFVAGTPRPDPSNGGVVVPLTPIPD